MAAISDYDHAVDEFDSPGADAPGGDVREPGPAPARLPLGVLLTSGGFITEAQLAEGLAEGARTGGRLGEVVVARGWATEDDVAKLLAEQWQLGYVDRASIFFDAEALARLSREQAQSLEALPTRMQDGRVVVAVAEPTEQRLSALRAVIGEDTVVVVVPKTALDAGLRSDLLSGSKTSDEASRTAVEAPHERRVDETAPVAAPESVDAELDEPGVDAARIEATPAVAAPAEEPELEGVLVALEAAAGEATALQLGVSELAQSLAGIVNDVASAIARLEQSRTDDADRRARLHQLEEELAQRTEVTESLKSQLVGLTRTLENFH